MYVRTSLCTAWSQHVYILIMDQCMLYLSFWPFSVHKSIIHSHLVLQEKNMDIHVTRQKWSTDSTEHECCEQGSYTAVHEGWFVLNFSKLPHNCLILPWKCFLLQHAQDTPRAHVQHSQIHPHKTYTLPVTFTPMSS